MLQLKEKKKSELTISIVLTVLLLAFLGLVFYVNLSCNPEYYDGDMYADIRYAKVAWEAKSLFPKGWLFGNQIYVVATPVLAAFFYGMIHNGIMAMAVASCVMSVLIVLTFDWMMKAVFHYNERTAGFLVMVGVLLLKAHIATGARGAQILFTMASYYACYIITAFIVYGCYIRIRQKIFNKKQIPMAIIGVLLSFATGMQSLRQTVIMTLPLIACEIIMTVIALIRDKKLYSLSSIIFTAVVSFANILGTLIIKKIPLQQLTIYGDADFNSLLDIKSIISKAILNFKYGIIGSFESTESSGIINLILPAAALLIIFTAFVINLVKLVKSKAREDIDFAMNIMLFFSCASVLAVSVLSTVGCKTIYYFMIFALLAQSIATVIKMFGKYYWVPECALAALFALLIVVKGIGAYNEICADKEPTTQSYQIASYMTENGYDTLYSIFGLSWEDVSGESVVVASNDEIYLVQLRKTVDWEEDPTVEYLHVKDDYKSRQDDRSLFLFNSEEYAKAKIFFNKHNIRIIEEKQFGAMHLCKLSENICALSWKK